MAAEVMLILARFVQMDKNRIFASKFLKDTNYDSKYYYGQYQRLDGDGAMCQDAE
jgi:hypothetical protein